MSIRKRETYNTSFVPAALASCMFQITVQDPVSYIQCTEWNGTTVFKRFGRKIYTSRMLPSESYSPLRIPKKSLTNKVAKLH